MRHNYEANIFVVSDQPSTIANATSINTHDTNLPNKHFLAPSTNSMNSSVYNSPHNPNDHYHYNKSKKNSNSNISSFHISNFENQNDEIKSGSSNHVSYQRHKFSQEEDIRLNKLIKAFGPKKWNTIALSMPGRTGRQCRDRFANYLNPSLTNGPWTVEDDILLQQKVCEVGLHWNIIAKFFKGRSSNNIKNRWYTYLCKNNQNASKQNFFNSNQDFENKSYRIDQVNNHQNNNIASENNKEGNQHFEINCTNDLITTSQERSEQLDSSNANHTNQDININIIYQNDKKIFYPPILPPDNIFNFDLNHGILCFMDD